jgi:hypothetical protein
MSKTKQLALAAVRNGCYPEYLDQRPFVFRNEWLTEDAIHLRTLVEKHKKGHVHAAIAFTVQFDSKGVTQIKYGAAWVVRKLLQVSPRHLRTVAWNRLQREPLVRDFSDPVQLSKNAVFAFIRRQLRKSKNKQYFYSSLFLPNEVRTV